VINVQTSHTQSVIRLPPGARLLASSSKDPHLAFAIGDRAWGVQFHPEFDADVVSSYISEESDVLVAEGQQPDLLLSAVQDTPSGDIILRRFAHLVPALNTAIHQEASSTV
jgi:GMP synthase (glutamine-hydrolysing)